MLETPASLFVAVADGLGHGPAAAEAASLACEFLACRPEPPLDALLRECDRYVARTRGLAATVVWIEKSSLGMHHVGVGNVEIWSTNRHVRPVCTPGIVGSRMRRVVDQRYQLEPNDRLAVFTDGVSHRFRLEAYAGAPQETADRIVADQGKALDDATCVVIDV